MQFDHPKYIIQSEVSQKDKHQNSTLMHIYGIQKDGSNNPICKTEKETHKCLDTVRAQKMFMKIILNQLNIPLE